MRTADDEVHDSGCRFGQRVYLARLQFMFHVSTDVLYTIYIYTSTVNTYRS